MELHWQPCNGNLALTLNTQKKRRVRNRLENNESAAITTTTNRTSTFSLLTPLPNGIVAYSCKRMYVVDFRALFLHWFGWRLRRINGFSMHLLRISVRTLHGNLRNPLRMYSHSVQVFFAKIFTTTVTFQPNFTHTCIQRRYTCWPFSLFNFKV